MVDRPTVYPKWADVDETDPVSGQSNVVEPPTAREDSGWTRREIPPRQWMNWLHRWTYRWIAWFDQELQAATNEETPSVLAKRDAAGRMRAVDPVAPQDVVTKNALDEAVPPGAIQYFAMQTAPDKWLAADGSNVSRTTYSRLFDAIGTTFGEGDGSTTFGLPPLRGVFVRGWDNGAGVDPSRGFGTYQSDEFKSHDHAVLLQATTDVGTGAATGGDPDTGDDPVATEATGGSETRPKNIALLACIKY